MQGFLIPFGSICQYRVRFVKLWEPFQKALTNMEFFSVMFTVQGLALRSSVRLVFVKSEKQGSNFVFLHAATPFF